MKQFQHHFNMTFFRGKVQPVQPILSGKSRADLILMGPKCTTITSISGRKHTTDTKVDFLNHSK